MLKKLTPILVLFVFVFCFSGCASTKLAPVNEDTEAKGFNTTPGKSTIYLYRNESMGAAVTMDVFLDGAYKGYTAANTYFKWDVDPGEHEIKSEAENTEILKLETVADTIYYVWQEVKMGFMYARNKLQQVDEAEGKKGVSESKLIAGDAGEQIMAERNKDKKANKDAF